MAVKVGDKAKTFTLPDQDGKPFDFGKILGKENIVLYFYPKDETPGCTAEACSFRDNIADFKGLDCRVIGISNDSVESHAKFVQHHNLPFTLLSDIDKKVVALYGVKASMFGLLPGRKTFVINKVGVITHIFDYQLRAKQHVVDALNAIANENQS